VCATSEMIALYLYGRFDNLLNTAQMDTKTRVELLLLCQTSPT
jgi:hypothetical protein